MVEDALKENEIERKRLKTIRNGAKKFPIPFHHICAFRGPFVEITGAASKPKLPLQAGSCIDDTIHTRVKAVNIEFAEVDFIAVCR